MAGARRVQCSRGSYEAFQVVAWFVEERRYPGQGLRWRAVMRGVAQHVNEDVPRGGRWGGGESTEQEDACIGETASKPVP